MAKAELLDIRRTASGAWEALVETGPYGERWKGWATVWCESQVLPRTEGHQLSVAEGLEAGGWIPPVGDLATAVCGKQSKRVPSACCLLRAGHEGSHADNRSPRRLSWDEGY